VIHKTFAVDGLPDLDVRIEAGRLEVHEGDPGKVDVTVDTKLPGFIVEQRGNSIMVSSDRDAGWLSRGSAYVVIETPAGSDLRAGVASAPVNVDVAMGKVEVKSASGDIEVDRVKDLVVKSASGDLHVEDVERALRVSSASGDVRVVGSAGGSVVISTASGDVEIEKSDATIEMNTASGDAYIRNFTGRSANFKAMSGSIDVGIPSRTTVELDVNTLSGKVRLPDPEPSQGEPLRHMSIRAKLVSGDFTIDRV
jgi:DUF4097 and DUF4098 domain-containing protein YvlB